MEKNIDKNLYELGLHDFTFVAKFGISVMRVPGGWLYTGKHIDVFVPFNNEFQEKPKKEKEPWQKKTLDERKQDFANELQLFTPTYKANILNEFMLYWCEPNQAKTKMKFELEKTWDMARRLVTWNKNANKFNPVVNDETSKQINWK